MNERETHLPAGWGFIDPVSELRPWRARALHAGGPIIHVEAESREQALEYAHAIEGALAPEDLRPVLREVAVTPPAIGVPRGGFIP